ncbi:MAG: imidazole glycerol phosphate synthase subunit HisH [Planctomycetota bacterium]|jgi:imidazole glycerol phosphate synthase glutamine amidotransferase subunit
MTRSPVTILNTGIANIASVRSALSRLSYQTTITRSPEAALDADRLVVPGVGSFRAGMDRLQHDGLVQPIRDRIIERRPTLSICLGMQLLCASSDEAPGIAGIGAIEGTFTRFPPHATSPQFGWNRVTPDSTCVFTQPGHAYFANSYRLENPPEGWSFATADHAGTFVAAIESGPVLACQFHPELSGRWGLDVLNRWLTNTRVARQC